MGTQNGIMAAMSTKLLTAESIRSLLAPHTSRLRDDFAVESLSLFGSSARGDATAESDVDLLVEFNRRVDLFVLVDLQEYLEQVLGVRVDVASWGGVRPRMRAIVERECVRVF